MPQHHGISGASGRRSTTKTSAQKEVLLKERTRKRAERAEARRVKAEEHHKAGNAYFREGKYCDAIAEFEVAIQVNGPTALYFSNMAAAWLKLKAYDLAEQCANRALGLDPQFTKARFRRGQARKGGLQLAAAGIDFATVLRQDPKSTETKKALDEIVVLMSERNENDLSVVDPEQRGPSINDPKTELESVSDSSDWNHEGNGYPCPFYNNDGCARGLECEFSHAPDHTGKSVRDRLGRNVSVRFLLGDCFGRCVYSHDKTYLPSGRWWESEEKKAEVRKMTTWDMVTDLPSTLPKCIAGADGRITWKSRLAAKTEEAFVWKGSVIMLEGLGDLTGDLQEWANFETRGRVGGGWPDPGRRSGWDDEPEENDEESEERSSNGGFEINPADVCQCNGLPRGPWFGRYWVDDDEYDICVDVLPLS